MLFRMLEWCRNKFVINVFAGLLLLVFIPSIATASAGHRSNKHLSYSTKLGQDLDGDHIPETAIIRQYGSVYQVSIYFTTGRPKLRLRTYITGDIAGLTVQTTDVNNDNKDDLVIISATSVKPIGIWLNLGKAKFQQASSWSYGAVGRYTGPTVRNRSEAQPAPDGNIFSDPLPQATLAVDCFSFGRDSTVLVSLHQGRRPVDSTLRQIPPRGPPATSHV